MTRGTPKPEGGGAAPGIGKRSRLLVVEDDKELSHALSRSFPKAEYDLRTVDSGEAALYVLGKGEYDLMILDIGLPGISGFDVLREIRAKGLGLSVLVLTARDSTSDRVLGLNLGADDYMVKPFEISELVARVRALGRRGNAGPAHLLVNGPLTMDLEGQRIFLDGKPVEIPRREWTILKALLERVDKIVSKMMIVEAVLKADGNLLTDNAIDVYISRLRTRFQQYGVQIRTVRGFGYMLARHRD